MVTIDYKLENVVDKEILQRQCQHIKHGTSRILNAVSELPVNDVLPEEVTNYMMLHLYQHEFSDKSFPETDNLPRTRNIGVKTFLAIEDYLMELRFIDKPRYRIHLEQKQKKKSYQ